MKAGRHLLWQRFRTIMNARGKMSSAENWKGISSWFLPKRVTLTATLSIQYSAFCILWISSFQPSHYTLPFRRWASWISRGQVAHTMITNGTGFGPMCLTLHLWMLHHLLPSRWPRFNVTICACERMLKSMNFTWAILFTFTGQDSQDHSTIPVNGRGLCWS